MSEPAGDARFLGPVFLIGMPRSGTKLLRGLLNRNPRVRIPDIETEFLPYWVKRWSSWGDLSRPEAFHRFYQDAMALPYFTYMRQSERVISEEDWRRAVRAPTPAGVFEALVRHDAGAPWGSDVVWGDKSPSYIGHMPLIKRLFPEARFVHIIRDVRDYCLSISQAWKKNPVRAAQRWVDGVERARRDAAAFRGDVLEVRYEDLVAEPEATLPRITTFLGVEFEPAMLELGASFELRGDAKGQHTIKRDNKEKWRARMDPALRRRVEAIAADVLRSCGYEVEHQGPVARVSAPELRLYQAADFYNLVRTDVHRWGLMGALRFRWRTFAVSGNRSSNQD